MARDSARSTRLTASAAAGALLSFGHVSSAHLETNRSLAFAICAECDKASSHDIVKQVEMTEAMVERIEQAGNQWTREQLVRSFCFFFRLDSVPTSTPDSLLSSHPPSFAPVRQSAQSAAAGVTVSSCVGPGSFESFS